MNDVDRIETNHINRPAETPGLPEVMTRMSRIATSLKQWTIFHAVAECGTFSSAAEFLHVSQGSIGYAISQLEEALGISLLRLEGRKYNVTDAGRELLCRSKFLLSEAIALETLASALRNNNMPQLKVSIEKDFPTRDLIPALSQYLARRRGPKIKLTEIPKSAMERVLRDLEADIAISSTVPSSYTGELFLEVEYVAVASADNPILSKPRPISDEDLMEFVQIITLDEDEVRVEPGNGPPNATSGKFWYVTSIETAITAVCEGIGYGWIPRSRIEESLERGKLVEIPLKARATFVKPFYLIQGRSSFYRETENLVQVLRAVVLKNRYRGRNIVPRRRSEGQALFADRSDKLFR
jgi:DNA-binding transcriptional LysR family regulator